MPLQNRVTPDGQIVSDPQRGDLMGNRGGVLHTSDRQLAARRWVSRRWIACALAFRGRRRRVMGDGYTELFFLDEATALAAGHRPCFECRRQAALAFARAWAVACGLDRPPSADAMDRVLHTQRLATRPLVDAGSLPYGAMYDDAGRAMLVAAGAALPWSFAGYGKPEALPSIPIPALTPACTIAALKCGYRPRLHASADVPS